MNLEMIEYFANIERRVNKLADQIEDLKSIMVEIQTYVCQLCGKTFKKVVNKSE